MTRIITLLSGCLAQAQAVAALGVEGQVIFGIFIPLTILVMTICVGRACWTWYLIHGLSDRAYDPYLDITLRTKYPAHTEPPSSNGRIICKVGSERLGCASHEQDLTFQTDLKSKDETSLGPTMSSMALATYKIGRAMTSHLQTTNDILSDRMFFSPKAKRSEPRSFGFEKTIPSPEILINGSRAPGIDLNDTAEIPLHSSPHSKNPSVPLFRPYFNSPQAISAIEDTTYAPETLKRPNNPYGILDKISRRKLSIDSDQAVGFCDVSFDTNFPSFAFSGLKPRFSHFMRVKWAQIKRRLRRVGQRRTPVLTSRDLQKDVKLNEEKTLFTISEFRDQLMSSHIPSCGAKEERFELGPITLPLRHVNVQENNSTRWKPELVQRVKHKRRKEKKAHLLKRRSMYKSPSKLSHWFVPRGRRSCTLKEVERKTERNLRKPPKRLVQREFFPQKHPECSIHIHKSTSAAMLSDDEYCSEHYYADFDELFAKTDKR